MVRELIIGTTCLWSIWTIACWLDDRARCAWVANFMAWTEGLRWLAIELFQFLREWVVAVYRRSPDLQRWVIRRSIWTAREFRRGLAERKMELRKALGSGMVA